MDWAQNLGEQTILKFLGPGRDWEQLVDDKNGNYDYLMQSDLDLNSPAVRTELARWGAWYLETTGVDGFRLDVVKHIQFSFFRTWLDHLRRIAGRELFAVGEYWNPDAVASSDTACSPHRSPPDSSVRFSWRASLRFG
jgi:alpha-amylase